MVDRITADELADAIDEDRTFTLVDTRQPDSFEAWHVSGAENVPYDPTDGFDDDHRRRVEDAADGDPIVVICGKGLTSTPFGIHLEDDGYESRDGGPLDDVTVVRGGMEAWTTVHEPVAIANDGRESETADPLVVRQLQRRATGCLGYLVGDAERGEAIVVDPTRQVEPYVVAAESADLSVSAVVDTHVHADHLSGGPELAAELDVPYFLGIDVPDPKHDFDALADGEVLTVGDAEVRALHTPGHTAEQATLVVDDRYVLSNDTLHLDAVGRTELSFGEEDAERGAELLYESLHDRILSLDDDATVLPGHVSVAADGRFSVGAPGEPLCARLGDLRSSVDLLDLDRETFVDELTDDLPAKPANYETIIAVNAGEEDVSTEEDAAELETGPNSCSA